MITINNLEKNPTSKNIIDFCTEFAEFYKHIDKNSQDIFAKKIKKITNLDISTFVPNPKQNYNSQVEYNDNILDYVDQYTKDIKTQNVYIPTDYQKNYKSNVNYNKKIKEIHPLNIILKFLFENPNYIELYAKNTILPKGNDDIKMYQFFLLKKLQQVFEEQQDYLERQKIIEYLKNIFISTLNNNFESTKDFITYIQKSDIIHNYNFDQIAHTEEFNDYSNIFNITIDIEGLKFFLENEKQEMSDNNETVNYKVEVEEMVNEKIDFIRNIYTKYSYILMSKKYQGNEQLLKSLNKTILNALLIKK
ncbi:hypothetical protein [Mycoplasmopsis alligatoris]|uniref:Uncharacterized protein n=1 Tax=Mycoplasmopsis alligatoris A21JP2 TaxID=747682 RepID=D4XVS2_9BACT|nr:hypothetical protein [Mycoplasmopsis alligatoris]EFF41559.1 hypothetical protein MALL_0209 [Mycoplasmopsis alligatoris A21JP2]